MNKFLLIAALAQPTQFRDAKGTPVAELQLAGERHIVDHQGKARNLPFYVRAEGMGKIADNIQERGYEPGDVLLIEGVADYSEWPDRERPDVKQSTVKMKITGAIRKLDGFQTTLDAGGNHKALGGMNRVTVIGNLGADVDIRYTEAGDPVTSVRLAVNEKFTKRDGTKGERVHWFTVTLWRDQALAVQGLKKGASLFVEGALSDEKFTDKEGHERRAKVIEGSCAYPVVYTGTPGQPVAAAPAAPAPQPSREGSQQADDINVDDLF